MAMGRGDERCAPRSRDAASARAALWTIPNALTLLRVLLVVPFVLFYEAGATLAAAITFAVAALSDGLDGFLARRLDQQSRLGERLDPLADKLLCLAALVVLVLNGRLPGWLLWASLTRDGVVLAIALVSVLRHRATPSEPLKLGKLATFATNLAVIAALLLALWPAAALAGTVRALSLFAALLLALAAIGYAWRALGEGLTGAPELPAKER